MGRRQCFICNRWVKTEFLTQQEFNTTIEEVCFSCLTNLEKTDQEQEALALECRAREAAKAKQLQYKKEVINPDEKRIK